MDRRMAITQLIEIRSRYDNSTPGVWQFGLDWADFGAICSCGEESEYVYGGQGGRRFKNIPAHEQIANARFIAHAHQDIPNLLEEICRLRAIILQLCEDNAVEKVPQL